jgi:hypothetical protein
MLARVDGTGGIDEVTDRAMATMETSTIEPVR